MIYLQGLKANVIPYWAVIHVVLLIRVQIQKVHHLVGLDGALQEEDEQSAGAADVQIAGQQAGDGFIEQRLCDGVAWKTGPQSVRTDLHAELDAVFTHLVAQKTEGVLF